MKRNITKSLIAMAYVVIGGAGALLSMTAIAYMYFSTVFLPVYIGNTYVIGNQLIRYGLYAILAIIVILSVKLAGYGLNFLIKKFHKIIKRR